MIPTVCQSFGVGVIKIEVGTICVSGGEEGNTGRGGKFSIYGVGQKEGL